MKHRTQLLSPGCWSRILDMVLMCVLWCAVLTLVGYGLVRIFSR